MNFSPILASLCGISFIVTLIGFRNPVHFVSNGYAFAIAGMAAFVAFNFGPQAALLSLLHSAMLLAWGLRLGIFLLRRERQHSFQNEKNAIQRRYGFPPLTAKVVIWIAVSVLYVLMFSPNIFDITANPALIPGAVLWQSGGLLVMIAGLVLETLADRQKTLFKQRAPRDFCSTGLYAWVRCPNYFAEILFWSGNWLMGIPFYTTPLRWIAATFSWLCLVLIMMGSTKRLERAQAERYGERADYIEYIRSVPVLFPFVPLFSLLKIRVFLE